MYQLPPLSLQKPYQKVSYQFTSWKLRHSRIASSLFNHIASMTQSGLYSHICAYISATTTTYYEYLSPVPTDYPSELLHCRGPVHCLKHVIETEGFRGLGRGTSGTLAREIPGNALFFTLYEVIFHDEQGTVCRGRKTNPHRLGFNI